jgi:hypothetical protein
MPPTVATPLQSLRRCAPVSRPRTPPRPQVSAVSSRSCFCSGSAPATRSRVVYGVALALLPPPECVILSEAKNLCRFRSPTKRPRLSPQRLREHGERLRHGRIKSHSRRPRMRFGSLLCALCVLCGSNPRRLPAVLPSALRLPLSVPSVSLWFNAVPFCLPPSAFCLLPSWSRLRRKLIAMAVRPGWPCRIAWAGAWRRSRRW